MNSDLYDMIFKRKSFHLFKNIKTQHLSDDELREIENEFNKITPLVSSIKVKIKIVKDIPTCKRGQEYCILFYSEIKDNYLQNIGYIGEELELYLVKRNIATLWYGIGKPLEETIDGLSFVIMMAISKVDSESYFRKDMYKSKRKDLTDVWKGEYYLNVGNIVRFAPSACNIQPWIVYSKKDELKVFLYKKEGKRGIMPKDKVLYYNEIDMGIFLCFLELSLLNEKIKFNRVLNVNKSFDNEQNLIATYILNND